MDGDEPEKTDECLCPYDIRRNGPIIEDELYRIFFQRDPGARVVMISDSCHFGTVARFAPISTPPTTRGKAAPQRTMRFLPPTVYSVYFPRRKMSRLGERRPSDHVRLAFTEVF